jgi:uncharacterized membrane protein
VGSNQKNLKNQEEQQKQLNGPKLNDPTDRSHWHAGFYSNPEDPRGIVPRNNGLGSTVNFGNARQTRMFIIMLLTILVPIFVAVILIFLLHH